MTSSTPDRPHGRRGFGRRLDMGDAGSLLDEMYDAGPPTADEVPVSRSPRKRRQHTDTHPPSVPVVADTPPPADEQVADSRPRRLGNRVPDGMVKNTLYMPKATAEALDAAAQQLVRQLGGTIPKHRVLTALITAGIDAAADVRTTLRAEVLASMEDV